MLGGYTGLIPALRGQAYRSLSLRPDQTAEQVPKFSNFGSERNHPKEKDGEDVSEQVTMLQPQQALALNDFNKCFWL